MRRLSIRWKLTLWYSGVLAAVLVLFSVIVYAVMRHQLLGRIDQGLNEELADVLSEIGRHDDSQSLLEWLNRRFAHHEGFDFEITDSRGQRVFANPRLIEHALSFADAADDSASPHLETLHVGSDGNWRVIGARVTGPEGSLTVKVGRSLASFEHETQELLFTFILAGPLTLLIAVSGGYFLARRALAPVQDITQTARKIGADRLSERIAVNNRDDELGTLAETLNEMIERLERSFAEMQRFTADAAHELRTPLAVIRNEAEVALRSNRCLEEYRRVLEDLLEETNRLSVMADQLLFLCRQDAGLQPHAEDEVQVTSLLADIVANMQLLAQEKRISLTLQNEHQIPFQGDGRQLRRVFYNLLDNAIKYTPPAGAVTVAVDQKIGHLSVTVADTGIGISSEHLPRIFDRFYRVDPSRSADINGAGLGLSICQSVVRRAGGTIRIESRAGVGTTVTVCLPKRSRTGQESNQGNGNV
jgi:heavy metal sensor kinase